MNIAICDNDENILKQITMFIKDYFDNTSITPQTFQFKNGNQMRQCKTPIDIIFADIELPDSNGLKAAYEIKKNHPNMIIIVITSYDRYLDDAFEYDAYRFIHKPIEKAYFNSVMDNALNRYKHITTRIILNQKNEIKALYTNEIVMIEKNNRKTVIHTINSNIETCNTIEDLVSMLPPGFYRIHKTCIINFSYISSFNHETVQLYNNSYLAYIPRRRYKDFKNSYLFYMSSTS